MPWRAKSSARRRNCSSVWVEVLTRNHYFTTETQRHREQLDNYRFATGCVADRPDKNLLPVRQQPRHYAPSGLAAPELVSQRRDRRSRRNRFFKFCRSVRRSPDFSVSLLGASVSPWFNKPTRTANPQTPWDRTATNLRLFHPPRHNAPAIPTPGKSQPPLRPSPCHPTLSAQFQ